MARKGENIRKRKDGRWEGRYLVKDYNGTHYRSVYAKTYLEVKEKLVEKKNGAVTFGNLDNRCRQQDNTFGMVAEEWLKSIKDTRKNSTYQKYSIVYEKRLSPMLGSIPIQDITRANVSEVLGQTMSDSMKMSTCCVAKQILNYGVYHYHMKEIRLKKVSTSHTREPVRVLNISEQAKLLKFIHKDMDIHKLGILLCLSTGLRLGEICALKWEDIDVQLKVLHVNSTVQRIRAEKGQKRTILLEGKPKTSCSVREIPISEQLLLLLQEHRTAGIYFLNGNKPMEPRTYQNKFKTYLKLANLEETNFHILRHTFATNCINHGTDVKSLSEMLGHSDVNITLNRYVHPSIDVKRNHINTLSTIYGQYLGIPS